jgi:aldose 1-epimerase
MPGEIHGSGDQVVLVAGDMRLTVVTWGGGMRELMCGDWAVLDGYGVDEFAPGGHGQPLIPWPNRLAGGRYRFRARTYQVPITEPDKQNALHGFARWMTWTVDEKAPDRVVLGLTMYPRSGYPFLLRIHVEYTVTRDGVRIVTTARNDGREALPYGSGFHPYVSAGTPRIDDAVLELPAESWLRTDERQIPVGVERVEGTGFDFRNGHAVGAGRLDTAFTDLRRDAGGMARVRLSSPDGSQSVAVWMDATYRYVMAYTGDTLADPARRRRSLAVEPMTCAPNAFETGDGLQVLEPGDQSVSAWGIEVRGAG